MEFQVSNQQWFCFTANIHTVDTRVFLTLNIFLIIIFNHIFDGNSKQLQIVLI